VGLVGLEDAPRPGGRGGCSPMRRSLRSCPRRSRPPQESLAAAGVTHWSLRRLADWLRRTRGVVVSHDSVCAVWRRFCLQPHRTEVGPAQCSASRAGAARGGAEVIAEPFPVYSGKGFRDHYEKGALRGAPDDWRWRRRGWPAGEAVRRRRRRRRACTGVRWAGTLWSWRSARRRPGWAGCCCSGCGRLWVPRPAHQLRGGAPGHLLGQHVGLPPPRRVLGQRTDHRNGLAV